VRRHGFRFESLSGTGTRPPHNHAFPAFLPAWLFARDARRRTRPHGLVSEVAHYAVLCMFLEVLEPWLYWSGRLGTHRISPTGNAAGSQYTVSVDDALPAQTTPRAVADLLRGWALDERSSRYTRLLAVNGRVLPLRSIAFGLLVAAVSVNDRTLCPPMRCQR
jgi:hypothetical protein